MTNDRTRLTESGADSDISLIDIGINLAHDSFDRDRDEVVHRARSNGVVQMVITGSSGASVRTALQLARADRGRLFATAGVHPHHATELNDSLLAELEELAREPEIVAIGECGLDYFRDFSPREAQRAAFHRQLELACRAAKPLFLHQRDAHDDFIAILKEHRPALGSGGVAHCFTGTGQQLSAYLEMGLAIGIHGWICHERRVSHLRTLVREIPDDRLLLETDAPYLLPRDLDPKPSSRRNEPAFLKHIATTVALSRGQSLALLASSSTRAARRLFNLPI